MSQYFKKEEFACKCGCGTCSPHPLLLAVLDYLRFSAGCPILVGSGSRCKKHNAEEGGATDSAHLPHKDGTTWAADLHSKQLELVFRLAVGLGLSVGDGRKQGFVHVDIRNLLATKPTRWGY